MLILLWQSKRKRRFMFSLFLLFQRCNNPRFIFIFANVQSNTLHTMMVFNCGWCQSTQHAKSKENSKNKTLWSCECEKERVHLFPKNLDNSQKKCEWKSHHDTSAWRLVTYKKKKMESNLVYAPFDKQFAVSIYRQMLIQHCLGAN